jgi:hypothetical protein
MTTNAQVVQLFTDVLERWNEREAEFRNWLGGTAVGGPNLDGRYPLTNGSNETYLVASPAKLADTVSGPAALSEAAKVAAEAAKVLAESASTQANNSRLLAENHKTAAQSARDLALIYRDQCAAAQAVVLSLQTNIASFQDDMELTEALTNEAMVARDEAVAARNQALAARAFTTSTANPTGGADGDVWFKVGATTAQMWVKHDNVWKQIVT